MRFRIGTIISMFVVAGTLGQDLGNRVSYAYSPTPAAQVRVTNNYSSPLTGVVIVTVGPHGGRGITWFDSAINFRHDQPIKPGESRTFAVGHALNQDASTLQPKVMAVTFDDLSSAGDSQWVFRFHSRRKAAYEEIAAVSALLGQALSEHQPNDEIIATLHGLQGSLRTSNPDKHARAAASLVIEAAMSNLERGGVRGAHGDPQKTIPAVVMPLFAEWRGALQRYDTSVP